jgi:dienelactone hydrolase
LIISLVLSFSLPADAHTPALRFFTASDLASGHVHLAGEQEGQWHVFAWDRRLDHWTLEQRGTEVDFLEEPGEVDSAPDWQKVGTLRMEDEPLFLHFPRSEPEEKADEKEAPHEIVTAPRLLVISASESPDLDGLRDRLRGDIDTAAAVDDHRRATIRTNRQGAGFDPPDSLPRWQERARALRTQMRVALGLWPEPPRTPLRPRVFGRSEHDGYTLEKVVLETLPGFYLAGNLFRPLGAPGRRPAILSPHGHWEDGRLNPEVQQRCIRWAKLGFVTFMYDMVGYNDSKDFGHKFLTPRGNRWGLSLATLQTWNTMRALDWIETLPDVDSARIGCTGESGGGTQTFLLSALDERVASMAPVVMVSEGFQGGCVCENAAGLRHGTDNVEFAALAAPRPQKLIGATGDWTSNTLTAVLPRLQEVYKLHGLEDRVTAEVFDFPHNYNQTSRNAVYPFLGRWLGGPSDPEETREGEQTVLPPEELRVFGPDTPQPENRLPPAQLEALLIEQLRRSIEDLGPLGPPAQWQAGKQFLLSSLRVRLGIDPPACGRVAARSLRSTTSGGIRIEHLVLSGSGTDQVPLSRLTPENPSGQLVVIADEEGKAGLLDRRGGWSDKVPELLERGATVVGFDPFLVGDSCDPADPRPTAPHFETYNKSIAAERAQDLATVLSWASGEPQIRAVHLIAQREMGPLALLALPVLPPVSRTFIDLGMFDYAEWPEEAPAGLDLPGVLQFGGLEAAAALSAPRELYLAAPAESFREEWPRSAYRAAGSPGRLRINRDLPTAEELAAWITGSD